MKDLILAAIPVIASVLGITVVSTSCKSVIKIIINKTIKNLSNENDNLKKSLTKLNGNLEEQKKENSQLSSYFAGVVSGLRDRTDKMQAEIEELKLKNDKLNHISDELAIIKNATRNANIKKEK